MKIVAACCLVLSTLALAADTGQSAQGTFKSQAITLPVQSAVAYRGKSFLDKGSDALIVAITNASLRPEGMAAYYDHDALVKRDRAALKPLLSNRLLENWSDAEKRNILGKYVDFLAGEHPERSVRIVRSFATADRAVVVISGDGAVGKMRGEAILKKEKDNWRVDDEITDLAN